MIRMKPFFPVIDSNDNATYNVVDAGVGMLQKQRSDSIECYHHQPTVRGSKRIVVAQNSPLDDADIR